MSSKANVTHFLPLAETAFLAFNVVSLSKNYPIGQLLSIISRTFGSRFRHELRMGAVLAALVGAAVAHRDGRGGTKDTSE